MRTIRAVIVLAVLLCAAAAAAWLATGREGYTRWPDERLARSDAPPSAEEAALLAEAGLADESGPATPQIRNRFAMGLVPGGFDPAHLLSVAGVVAVSGLLVCATVIVHLCSCRRRSPATSPGRDAAPLEVPQCDRP